MQYVVKPCQLSSMPAFYSVSCRKIRTNDLIALTNHARWMESLWRLVVGRVEVLMALPSLPKTRCRFQEVFGASHLRCPDS